MAGTIKELQNQKELAKFDEVAKKIQGEDDTKYREPKISVTEIVFITPLYLMSDTIDFSLLMIGMDDFAIMDTVRTFISQFYFVILKKMGPEIWMKNLAINGLKMVPYVGSFIPATLIWVIVISIDRSPMIKDLTAKALKSTGELGRIMRVALKNATK